MLDVLSAALHQPSKGEWQVKKCSVYSHGFNIYTNVQPFSVTSVSLFVNMTFRFLDYNTHFCRNSLHSFVSTVICFLIISLGTGIRFYVY
jgi:hypothetical protein